MIPDNKVIPGALLVVPVVVCHKVNMQQIRVYDLRSSQKQSQGS